MPLRINAAALIAAVSLALTGCAANEEQPAGTTQAAETTAAALSGTLTGIGASSQDVAQQTWIAGFQTDNPGVTVNYSPEGSGTGREAFIAGGANFAGSDRAYKLQEIADNKFAGCAADAKPLDLPVYVSPIAVVFNVDGVKSLNMTPKTIAGIFKGDILKWNDAAIAADNPGVTLPDLAITAVHRSDTSGTTENFTDFLHGVAPDVWDAKASGDWPYQGGESAAQTQGVVAAVSGGVGTIGYVDASQASKFSIVSVGSNGKFNAPTAEAAAAVVDNSPVEDGRAKGDMAIKLDRKAEGYPIVLVSYLIVCSDYAKDDVAGLVKGYATHIVSEAGQAAAAQRAGSAPISATLRDQVMASINSMK